MPATRVDDRRIGFETQLVVHAGLMTARVLQGTGDVAARVERAHRSQRYARIVRIVRRQPTPLLRRARPFTRGFMSCGELLQTPGEASG